MSISLKNHEDRIKVLENKANSSNLGTVEILLSRGQHSGDKTLAKNITSFTFIIMLFEHDGSIFTPITMPTRLCQTEGRSYFLRATGAWGVDYKFPSDTIINVRPQRSSAYSTVYGLKIYYIFRYNIYKILKLISPILKF